MAGTTALEDVSLSVKGQDVALRYPGDFKSRVEADLELRGRSDDLVLGGQVKVLRGLYDSDIQIEDALRLSAAATEKTPEAVASVGLDLDVSTQNPILVRNNLAELDVTGRLDVRGDVADPAPFGRLEVGEGGKVFLQTREFTVERGALVYQGTFEPEIDVRAKTVIREPAGDVEVTVAADGPLLGPTLHLSSVPDYSEKEIASLVATGRRNVAGDSTAWVAGEQAAALLAGRVTRSLSRGFEQLGFDEVTIQPELLAREADPSARFTFGKHVTPHFRLIYSIGLSDAEERFVEGQYRFRLGQDITARLIRADDGVLTYGIGQRWRFGVPDRRARSWTPRKTRLAEVSLKGDAEAIAGGGMPQPGDEVTTWDLLADAERIERRLRRAGHLEALVSSDLEGEVATFTVNAGPRYFYEVKGLSSPPRLDDVLSSALYEEEALEEGTRRLLDAARARGHLRARVSTSVVEEERVRRLVFAVDPGRPVKDVQVRFPGASALGEGELLRAAGGAGALLTSGAAAREAILAAYNERWYLSVEVDPSRVVEAADGSRVTIEVPVREGPRARLAAVRFEGTTLPDADIRQAVALEPGPVPEPEALTQAARRLRDEYLERGHTHARVRPRLAPAGTDLEVVFDVDEGERRTVGAVRITGLRRTKESLVRRQVDLRAGDPLNPRRLGVLEKRLLDLGVFSRVVVTASDEDPAVVDVRVEEQGPFSLAYDVRFSAEERATTLVDVEAGNLGGIGLAVGGRYRVGRDLRETRASVHLPSLGRGGDTTASVFQLSEDFRIVREGATGPVLEDTSVQKGLQLQQTIHSAGRWTVLGGFTFKNVSSQLTGLSHDLSGLQASVVRESRDNPLDARTGSFLSLSLEGGGGWTASDFDYFRLFAQGFGARALGRAFTWAQGYRLGLARGLEAQRDQQLSVFARSTELFHAGGPTSLRGYALDSVGPTGPHGFNPGGEALVVINQEIRYRHPWGVGGAVFYDVGNVFARVQDIGLDLRHSLGIGLRYDSPLGLLRLDIGFPLNPRPQDRRFQWFFALGQAF
jgi:outer membrane protein assembly factor BamA